MFSHKNNNISEGMNVEFTYEDNNGQVFLLKFNLGLYKWVIKISVIVKIFHLPKGTIS
jgi:hypothetical protein